MSWTADMSDFFEFADDCEQAAAQAGRVFGDAAADLGDAIEGRAVINAKPHRKSGSMEQETRATPKVISSTMAKVEVASSAVSAKGFPYPLVIDGGRKGFTIVAKGKALALPIAETKGKRAGQTPMFRKTVTLKPYAGSKFFTRAVDDTRPEVDVRMDMAIDELLNPLRGR